LGGECLALGGECLALGGECLALGGECSALGGDACSAVGRARATASQDCGRVSTPSWAALVANMSGVRPTLSNLYGLTCSQPRSIFTGPSNPASAACESGVLP